MKKIKQLLIGAALCLALPTNTWAQTLTEVEDVELRGILVNLRTDDGDEASPGRYIGWDYETQTAIIGNSDYGVWSIKLKNDQFQNIEQVNSDHLKVANSGAIYRKGYIYTFFSHERAETDTDGNDWEFIIRQWDANTYEKVGEQTFAMSENLESKDMCYDPYDDKVYGVFQIAEGSGDDANSGYKLCSIDLQTMTLTQISGSFFQTLFVALAVSPEGRLFGISTDGSFWEFNKQTGAPSVIGNVGFKTQAQRQSATFDMRTGKLYWVGFMNTGKDSTGKNLTTRTGRYDTGLYEVNTETGVATLIKKLPVRQQLSGLYVVGGTDMERDYDLAIELSTPKQIKVKQAGTFSAYVKNLGEMKAENYKVNLYCNDKLVATVDGEALESGEGKYYQIQYTAKQGDSEESVFYATVEDPRDEIERNNTSVAYNVVILYPNLSTTELYGRLLDGKAQLEWEEPDQSEAIVDGAENYAPFIIDEIGDWTMYDGDKGYTVSMNSAEGQRQYPNKNRPMAFMVFNPEMAGLSLEPVAIAADEYAESQFIPYSGDQVFIAFSSVMPKGTSSVPVQNDDWMISPELSGEAQTITFQAQSYASMGYYSGEPTTYAEAIQVLYSTTGTNPEDFQVVEIDGNEVTEVPDEWTEFSFDVPEGAKHFAIRCVSEDQFFLMIDDIEYLGKVHEILGYNLYRDGEKVNDEPLSTIDFEEVIGDVRHEYNVTVVYDDGESAFSNTVTLGSTTGIETVVNGQHTVLGETYDLNGRHITGTPQRGIYIRNGKKFVIK